MRIINEIRESIIDPQAEEERRKLSETAGRVKAGAGLGCGICCMNSVAALITAIAYPLIGIPFFLFGTIGCVALREVAMIARNTEEMMEENIVR